MPGEPVIRGTTRLAGVVGWPVEHSRSPQMHNAAYAALGVDWAYVPLAVPPGRLADAVRGLAALGFAGVNVTIPHKQAVAGLVDELSDAAREAGSVNTVLVRDDGSLRGETTDGDGLLDALGELPDGRAVVLGAGGSARSVVAALRSAGTDVARVRTASGGGRSARRCRIVDWPLREPAGLIVNATPVAQQRRRRPSCRSIPRRSTARQWCATWSTAPTVRARVCSPRPSGAARARWMAWRCWSDRVRVRSACSRAPSRRST